MFSLYWAYQKCLSTHTKVRQLFSVNKHGLGLYYTWNVCTKEALNFRTSKNTHLPCTSASVPWIWTPLWSRTWESDLGYISFDSVSVSASVFLNFLFCRYAFHHDSLVLRGNLRSKTVLQLRRVSPLGVSSTVYILVSPLPSLALMTLPCCCEHSLTRAHG